MHKTWSRAEQFRSSKESHQIFPTDGPAPRRMPFSTTFEKEQPSMGLLLGWEYGRLWLKEHKEYVNKELTNAKAIFIDPDFSWWVNKRSVVMDRRQFFLKNKQNPHVKNCNLSAFAIAKNQRQKKEKTEQVSDSLSESQKQGRAGNENSSTNVNMNIVSNVISNAISNVNSKASSKVDSKANVKDNSKANSNATMGSKPNENSSLKAKTNTNSNSDSNAKGKLKKCNCKDCVQRRCGGQEIKSGSYGPDNRKLFYVTRKVVSMPWY